MILELKRAYPPEGTTGEFSIGGHLICSTIELAWLNNQKKVSCIPEGTYELVKHNSHHLGDVLMLLDVPNRDFIYIHSANDASEELLGCIAPVQRLTGNDSGVNSRASFYPIRAFVYAAIDAGEKVYLKIYS